MSWGALLEAWGRWPLFSQAAPERLWWLWAIGAALLLALLRWAWGQRLALAGGAAESGAGLLRLLAPLPKALRLAGLLLLLLALLRPQSFRSSASASVQALDIMLVLDCSGSMQANDLKPNRLEAAKQSLIQFVDALPGDRIGLVVFAGKAFTQCPLTLDHDVVKHFISAVDQNTVRLDQTAVGDGLLMGLARLMSEQGAQQRLVVLATDGRSSIGQDPMQVAQLVAGQGIKLYTIGIGRKGGAIIQQQDVFGRLQQYRMEEPDEGTLSGMARVTGGRYFRATDSAGLKGIYSDIAGAERREVKVKKRRDADEQFYPFLWAGALLLLIEALLRLRLRVSA